MYKNEKDNFFEEVGGEILCSTISLLGSRLETTFLRLASQLQGGLFFVCFFVYTCVRTLYIFWQIAPLLLTLIEWSVQIFS